MTTLAELRELAERATPGPWVMQDYGMGSVYVDSHYWEEGPEPVAGLVSMSTPDARYIAACSPEVVKALVAVAEAAERSNDAFFHGPAANSHAYALRDALDALAAAWVVLPL